MSLENTVENLIDALHTAREHIYKVETREYLATAIRMAENDLAYAKLDTSDWAEKAEAHQHSKPLCG